MKIQRQKPFQVSFHGMYLYIIKIGKSTNYVGHGPHCDPEREAEEKYDMERISFKISSRTNY